MIHNTVVWNADGGQKHTYERLLWPSPSPSPSLSLSLLNAMPGPLLCSPVHSQYVL